VKGSIHVLFHQDLRTEHSLHEPSSYWQETAATITLSSELPSTAEVVIIGGGILGSATCYWLARAGVEVVLLEHAALAHGATGRNGGFVSIGTAQSYRAATARLGREVAQSILKATLQNKALLQQMLAEETIACDYREPGSLHLALNEDQWRSLAREVTALQADGIGAKMLDRGQVQDLVRTPLSPEILGGRFLSEDGVLHPVRLVQGVAQASLRHGARISHATALQLVSDGQEVQVHTTHGTLHAGKVIVATNAWIRNLLPEFSRLIIPVRGQMLAYAPMATVFPVGMSASLTDTGEYWQQRTDGTIVLGGCRAVAAGRDEDVLLSVPTAEVQSALEHVFPRLFPWLPELQVENRWAGLMAFTPDSLPIADRVPEKPNMWVVGGFSGHGMPFGMRLSQLLTEAVMSSEIPADLKPFLLNRVTLRSGWPIPSNILF
jgi:gamma-glutamylputrescine oxidase